MITTASIWNNPAAESTVNTNAASASTAAAGQANSPRGIGANDFLTLLVTEMQNQDPTATTDPNEYVNQLVSVNSLEQLIQINETLQGAAAAAGASRPSISGTSNYIQTSGAPQNTTSTHSRDSMIPRISSTLSDGNLAVPGTHPAAQRVAQSLSGRVHL
jgi:flagellar basal-body rod modification protein FlgD